MRKRNKRRRRRKRKHTYICKVVIFFCTITFRVDLAKVLKGIHRIEDPQIYTKGNE